MSAWIWILVLVVAVVTAIVVTTLIVRRNDARKVGFMMDALEDGELNFHFKEKSALNRALNRIKGIFERRDAANEESSQNKLFRVMTHEIMNTVAPIASLSDALLTEEGVDVKAGLETISASSKDLIRFVESYRSMTQAQPPIRKAVMVDELMNRVLLLNKAKIAEQGATLTYQDQERRAGRCHFHPHHGRLELGRPDRHPCGQQRKSHPVTPNRGNLHSVLHHQTERNRHRFEFVETNHGETQRDIGP